MDLDTIMTGIAGGLALYVLVEGERKYSIDQITDNIIIDSCYRRTDNRPLRLPEKKFFKMSGYPSYKAIKRYEKVYAALQEMGEADVREVEKLFKVE